TIGNSNGSRSNGVTRGSRNYDSGSTRMSSPTYQVPSSGSRGGIGGGSISSGSRGGSIGGGSRGGSIGGRR
ncbi:MAG: hypothetical protein M3Z80_08895, partial [Apibacter sp.]